MCIRDSAQAEQLVAEGEAEYMRILSDAYSDESRSEFYSFVRSLDAVSYTHLSWKAR